MTRVAIYCRLSVEDRNKTNSFDDSESIQNQKILLTRFAVEKDWAVYKIYSDDDYSGLDKDRPEFNRMIDDAREGKFEIVLCKSQSRFTRDMELVEKYLHNRFPEWGIRFISVTDNADTFEKGNKKSRQINGLVNEWYCEDLSDAIKASFKAKREMGQFIGSFAAYGYIKDPADKNRLVIDEEAAQVVRLIFHWYLEGCGVQHIACLLNRRSILNPTGYKQSKGLTYINSFKKDSFGLWNKTTIRRILKNELYIGTMVQGIRKKSGYKSKLIKVTKPSEWYIVPNTHEPIIDGKIFELVQKRISSRVRSSSTGCAHLFASKVKCLTCGSTMNKVTAANGYTYLRCKLYAADPGKRLCTSHSVRLDQLVDIVSEQVKGYANTLCSDEDIAFRLQGDEEINHRVYRLQVEQDRLQKGIEEKDRILKNLYLDKLKGVISEKQFYDYNETFALEKEELEKRIARVKSEMKVAREKLVSLEHWVEVVRKYKDFAELSRTMVNELIDCIEIGEKNKKTGEQKIKIHWQF